eukprot:TRINITY_DN59211_c1_g1_i1.p2 TRINITY_DN59211_c1_g1~~TRINITY_DN59211_c1_g1_i1.p2  ORF type:complete len:108 (-),score=2.36 TRINITY_DN59211_c1_g1_i1:96-419(-)
MNNIVIQLELYCSSSAMNNIIFIYYFEQFKQKYLNFFECICYVFGKAWDFPPKFQSLCKNCFKSNVKDSIVRFLCQGCFFIFIFGMNELIEQLQLLIKIDWFGIADK